MCKLRCQLPDLALEFPVTVGKVWVMVQEQIELAQGVGGRDAYVLVRISRRDRGTDYQGQGTYDVNVADGTAYVVHLTKAS